jgi:hypothetical protein
MNRVKVILTGTIIGIGVGLSSLMITAVTWRLLKNQLPGHWDGTVTSTLLGFCLVQGVIIGTINGSLCPALCNPEQTIISGLLSLALAAVRVIPGGFGDQSLLPILIFGLALVNGGLTAVAHRLVLRRAARVDEYMLRLKAES